MDTFDSMLKIGSHAVACRQSVGVQISKQTLNTARVTQFARKHARKPYCRQQQATVATAEVSLV